MQIQLNTDHNITGSERLAELVQAELEDTLGRFSEHLTRIEVHINDIDGERQGGDDKRCMLEARFAGHQPVSVTHNAPEIMIAVAGAAEKLERALDRMMGKLEAPRRRNGSKLGENLVD